MVVAVSPFNRPARARYEKNGPLAKLKAIYGWKSQRCPDASCRRPKRKRSDHGLWEAPPRLRRSAVAHQTPGVVGADLSANAVFQPPHMRRMYRPFRGQVRSHLVCCATAPRRRRSGASRSWLRVTAALTYKYFNQVISRRRALSDANQRTAGNSITASTIDVSQTPHMWSKPK